MKRSAKTEYACLALLRLAEHYDQREWITQREICEGQDIPAGFVVQILQRLRQSGLVETTRGASGGYRLSQRPSAITFADVYRAVEGAASVPVRGHRDGGVAEALADMWRKAAAAEWNVMETTTLQDIAVAARDSARSMYHI